MAKILNLFISLFLMLNFTAVSFSYKILFLMPLGTKSHKNFYDSINFALVEAGHQITMISPYNRKKPIPNITDIQVESDFGSDFIGNAFEADIYKISNNYITKGPEACIATLLENDVQNALKLDYDLIILSFLLPECYFPSIYVKNVPWAYAYPLFPMTVQSEILGNIEYPTIVPDRLSKSVYPLTYFERMYGAISSAVSTIMMTQLYYKRLEAVCRDSNLWPDKMPSAFEFAETSSLGIVNSVRELEMPARPFSPSLVFAGGIHIKPAKPLSKDLDSWMQDSGEDGVILFSLGSIVKSASMKEEHRKIFVNVFSKLKQRVLWKWDGKHMDNLPLNVKLMDWVPQSDLLAHPKLRLFITHGGLLSTQEATYFGVPILGMPVFMDQMNNIERSASEGWALKLSWNELTEEKMYSLISNGIRNSSLLSVVRQKSAIMKDQPLSKEKEVVFWIEYVIRHGGAKHLQSPLASMPWYKIYNMDVWATIFLTIFLIIFLIVYVAAMLFKCCWRLVFQAKKEQIKIKPIQGRHKKRE